MKFLIGFIIFVVGIGFGMGLDRMDMYHSLKKESCIYLFGSDGRGHTQSRYFLPTSDGDFFASPIKKPGVLP